MYFAAFGCVGGSESFEHDVEFSNELDESGLDVLFLWEGLIVFDCDFKVEVWF